MEILGGSAHYAKGIVHIPHRLWTRKPGIPEFRNGTVKKQLFSFQQKE
jgi:hypothetical protein